MKSTITKVILSSFLLFLFNSCDRASCETNNPIFLNNEVLSQAYQKEVVKQIEKVGQDNLRFWLSDYVEKDDKHYLVFYAQNDDLCAEAVMHIDNTNKRFSEIVKTKGKGRFNAEFKGITFDVSSDKEDKFLLHYTGHESIVD